MRVLCLKRIINIAPAAQRVSGILSVPKGPSSLILESPQSVERQGESDRPQILENVEILEILSMKRTLS